MKEKPVEQRLRVRLERYGFKVLKLECPGQAGVPDRLILRPKWSPGAPWVCEVKRPGEEPRLLQRTVMNDWLDRGVLVLNFVSTYEEVDALVADLVHICIWEMRL